MDRTEKTKEVVKKDIRKIIQIIEESDMQFPQKHDICQVMYTLLLVGDLSNLIQELTKQLFDQFKEIEPEKADELIQRTKDLRKENNNG